MRRADNSQLPTPNSQGHGTRAACLASLVLVLPGCFGQRSAQGGGAGPAPCARDATCAPRRSIPPATGWRSSRRLALADDHAGQGRLSEHPDEPRGPTRGRSLGSGEGRSRRRAVPRLWRARPDARADSTAHHVAGRQHAQAGNRLRHADAPVPLRRHARVAGRKDVAGRVDRGVDHGGRRPRARAERGADR